MNNNRIKNGIILATAILSIIFITSCSPTKEEEKTSLVGTWFKANHRTEALDGTLISNDSINVEFLQYKSIGKNGIGQHLLPIDCRGFVLFYTVKIKRDSILWYPDSLVDSKKVTHKWDPIAKHYFDVDYVTGNGTIESELQIQSENQFVEVRKHDIITKITWKKNDERVANLVGELKDPSNGECF